MLLFTVAYKDPFTAIFNLGTRQVIHREGSVHTLVWNDTRTPQAIGQSLWHLNSLPHPSV